MKRNLNPFFIITLVIFPILTIFFAYLTIKAINKKPENTFNISTPRYYDDVYFIPPRTTPQIETFKNSFTWPKEYVLNFNNIESITKIEAFVIRLDETERITGRWRCHISSNRPEMNWKSTVLSDEQYQPILYPGMNEHTYSNLSYYFYIQLAPGFQNKNGDIHQSAGEFDKFIADNVEIQYKQGFDSLSLSAENAGVNHLPQFRYQVLITVNTPEVFKPRTGYYVRIYQTEDSLYSKKMPIPEDYRRESLSSVEFKNGILCVESPDLYVVSKCPYRFKLKNNSLIMENLANSSFLNYNMEINSNRILYYEPNQYYEAFLDRCINQGYDIQAQIKKKLPRSDIDSLSSLNILSNILDIVIAVNPEASFPLKETDTITVNTESISQCSFNRFYPYDFTRTSSNSLKPYSDIITFNFPSPTKDIIFDWNNLTFDYLSHQRNYVSHIDSLVERNSFLMKWNSDSMKLVEINHNNLYHGILTSKILMNCTFKTPAEYNNLDNSYSLPMTTYFTRCKTNPTGYMIYNVIKMNVLHYFGHFELSDQEIDLLTERIYAIYRYESNLSAYFDIKNSYCSKKTLLKRYLIDSTATTLDNDSYSTHFYGLPYIHEDNDEIKYGISQVSEKNLLRKYTGNLDTENLLNNTPWFVIQSDWTRQIELSVIIMHYQYEWLLNNYQNDSLGVAKLPNMFSNDFSQIEPNEITLLDLLTCFHFTGCNINAYPWHTLPELTENPIDFSLRESWSKYFTQSGIDSLYKSLVFTSISHKKQVTTINNIYENAHFLWHIRALDYGHCPPELKKYK